ncbi:MAG: hypothetical protein M1839_000185 [Geoglossum umbratile]|nr:MAG: hypothetical protein M1839_000185 [Geoglossum umbratile]
MAQTAPSPRCIPQTARQKKYQTLKAWFTVGNVIDETHETHGDELHIAGLFEFGSRMLRECFFIRIRAMDIRNT